MIKRQNQSKNKHMRNFRIFTWLMLFSFLTAYASAQTITGEVHDKSSGLPVVGASVVAGKDQQGTSTDAEGKFTLDLKGQKTITISFIGYRTQTITVGDRLYLKVDMEPESSNLDQVVVVGYGTQKKANLTGAVATVDVDKTLGSRPVTDVSRGLQGVVAGLTITTPTGEIGTNPAIRLRGLSGSLNGGGAKPLILVDNVEFPNLQMINPDDIESISVLKDAASTSIYGSRAAWGVILITTKSGKKGLDRSSINYSTNLSYAKPTTTPVIADAAEGAEMAFKAQQRTNPNLTVFGVVGMYFDQEAIQKMRDWQAQYGGMDLGPEMVEGRDFEIRSGRLFFYRPWDAGEMFLRKWTPQQIHNLTFNGSSKRSSYNLNLGYLNQEGVLKVNPDKFDRYNINLGVNSAVTDWFDARAKAILVRTIKTRPYYYSSETYDPWYYLYRWPKTYPYGTYEGKPFRSAVTEVQQAKMSEYAENLTRIAVGGTFKILPGLTIDADYTYARNSDNTHHTGGYVTAWDFWAGGGVLEYRPYTAATYDRVIYQSEWDQRSTFKAFATYVKKVQDHDFKVMAGTDVESYQYWYQSSEKRGLLDPNFGEPALAIGDQFVGGDRAHWATLGYFGRINYSWKKKLLLELNGRFDGSSNFPRNDQWAFFPSFSAGYVLSEEAFMNSVSRVLSYLKLRGSWGSVGNQDVGANRFLSVMSSSSSGWLVNGTNQLTMGTPGLVSPTLTWETVTTLDFGFDARFLNNKLGLTFDWYKRVTSDMISAGVTLPATLGTNPPVRNYGELTTKGWEISIDFNHRFDNGINFNATAVLSDFTEEITKFANTSKLLSSNFEGKRLGDIWGYETDRFFTKDDFVQDANGNLVTDASGKWIMKDGVPTQKQWEASWFFYGPGDIKYRDLNGDGKIDFGANTLDDHGDLRVIGNSTPRYQYGLRLGAEWKGVELSVFIQGVGKRNLWPNGPLVIPGYRPGEAWYQHQLDYWTEDNPNAYYPRPTDAGQSNNTRNFLPQTKYLLNLAYTRLKNLTVAYNLPLKVISKAKMQSARIYFSGENLFEIDHLKVPIDPEVDYTTAGLNDPNTFGRVYPYRRTLSFGLQVSF
jgi:TonB-linked SusC/RagA family outer membrane protein